MRYVLFPRDAPSSNSTDSRGRYVIYDTTPGEQYTLRASGYVDKTIWFPHRDNQAYMLKHAR